MDDLLLELLGNVWASLSEILGSINVNALIVSSILLVTIFLYI